MLEQCECCNVYATESTLVRHVQSLASPVAVLQEQKPAGPLPRAVRQNTHTAKNPNAAPSSDPGPDPPAVPEAPEAPFSKRPSPSSSTGSSELRRSGHDSRNSAGTKSVNVWGPQTHAASDQHDVDGATAVADSGVDQPGPKRKAYTTIQKSAPPPYNPPSSPPQSSPSGAPTSPAAGQGTSLRNEGNSGAKQKKMPPYNPPTNDWHSHTHVPTTSGADNAPEPSLQSGYPVEDAAVASDPPSSSLPTTSAAAAEQNGNHSSQYNARPGWADEEDTQAPNTAAGGPSGPAHTPAGVRENGHVGSSQGTKADVRQKEDVQQREDAQQSRGAPVPSGLATEASVAHAQPAQEEDVHMLGTTPTEESGIQPVAAAISKITSRQQVSQFCAHMHCSL